MPWTYSYYCSRLGLQFNQGDTIVVQGTAWTSTDKNSVGYTYTSPENKVFYGVFTSEYSYAPICIGYKLGDQTISQYYIEDSSIVGGGTPTVTAPVAGNMAIYAYDNRNGGSNPNTDGWFEAMLIQWNSFKHGTGSTIRAYELWYEECADNGNNTPDGNWSDRIHVKTIDSTATSGSTTLGSVNQLTSSSSWGNRNQWYRISVVALGTAGNYSDTTIFSNWIRKCNAYPINFDLNGGSWNTANTQYCFNNYPFIFPSEVPKKPGYTFQYWTFDRVHYSPNQSVIWSTYSAKRITAIYTQSTFTITYSANGGIGSNQTQSVVYGSTFTAKGAIFTRVGYELDYWTTPSGNWGLNASGTYGWTTNVTFSAHWKSLSQYTITYNANGGSGAPSNQSKYAGETIKLSSTTPTKVVRLTYNANGGSVSPSYKDITLSFRIWNTNSSGTGTNYSPGASYSSDSSITLYAQYNSNIFGTLPNPTRSQCIFVGWYTSIDGGNSVSSATSINSNTVIYARYDYIVKYDTSGFDFVLADQIKHHGESITISDILIDDPGKDFLGWSTNASDTSAQYTPGSIYSKNLPATLYPIFKKSSVTYTVIFDLAGGTSTGGELIQHVQYGESAILPSDPTKPGLRFTGWLGNYTNVTSDRTIRALWDSSPLWIYTGQEWLPFR